jgi:branched-subunit amino acid transport protein
MSLWSAVLLVAAGSYALRVTPFLFGAGLRVSPRAEDALRDAGAGGITALLVAATVSLSSVSAGPGPLAVVVAVLVAGCVACTGRSMTVVVLAGAAAHMLTIAVGALT